MSDSVFKTQTIEICVCDKCTANNVGDFIKDLKEKIERRKLTRGINIKPILHNGKLCGNGFFIKVNGIQVNESELNSFLKLTTSVEMEPFSE